ncbi:MAG TPA: hypothetical protein DDW52_14935 [Planctomycetaceae bacterium]|nr:hypothetical protein [Planctomycetaceae bacterium]
MAVANVLSTIEQLNGRVWLRRGCLQYSGGKSVAELVRLYKRDLTEHLNASCVHIPPAWELVEVRDSRRGWEKFKCARCGRFIGSKPTQKGTTK